MKKVIITIIIILFLAFGGYYFFKSNNSKNNEFIVGEKNGTSYETSKISSNTTANNKNIEEEISSFSTKIHNKDSDRTNNIQITCSSLNDTVVLPGETFSFCDTVGKATPEKGYEKADIFVNGEKKQGLGGGNCQVSTTLYNAVMAVPNLTVIERHEHSNHVPYIEDGKDAAVSFGTYDFKFKNDTGSKIKILASNTTENITIKIVKIS